MADVAYPISQKRRLVELVERLCEDLGRPVCSADVQRHLRLCPDDRPFLFKRIGQQLIAAAQPLKGPVGRRLYRIGTHAAKNYYALTPGDPWAHRFAAMVAAEEFADFERRGISAAFEEVRFRVPREAIEAALAAHDAEFDFLKLRLENPVLEPPKSSDALARRRSNGRAAFVLLDRPQAAEMLTELVRARRDSLYAFSPWRHLSELRWPQCSLSARRFREGYVPEQMNAYAGWRWPQRGEDVNLVKARFYGWRYGVAL